LTSFGIVPLGWVSVWVRVGVQVDWFVCWCNPFPASGAQGVPTKCQHAKRPFETLMRFNVRSPPNITDMNSLHPSNKIKWCWSLRPKSLHCKYGLGTGPHLEDLLVAQSQEDPLGSAPHPQIRWESAQIHLCDSCGVPRGGQAVPPARINRAELNLVHLSPI